MYKALLFVALFAVSCLPSAAQDPPKNEDPFAKVGRKDSPDALVGTYMIAVGSNGTAYRINTRTGLVWVLVKNEKGIAGWVVVPEGDPNQKGFKPSQREDR